MPQPNVILITAAGWRSECLVWRTPHGGPLTPNLHALSGQAAQHSLTGPADALNAFKDLAARYRAAGYSTAFIGDALLPAAEFDTALGHARYHDWLAQEGLADRLPAWHADFNAAPPEVRQALGAVRSPLPERAHASTWIGVNAARVLPQATGPFFLWLHFARPGFPFDPPAPWDDIVPRASLALPFRPPEGALFRGVPLTEPRLRRVWSHYLGNAALIDHQLGRVLSTLTARAITNTSVIFAATRPAQLGEDGHLSAWGDAGMMSLPAPLYATGAARAVFATPPTSWADTADRIADLSA